MRNAVKQLGRTGLMHSFVIALILLLIAFGIVFAWLYQSGALIDDEADVNICRATLALQSRTATDVGIIDFNSPLASSCKRRIISIDTEGASLQKPGRLSFAQPLPIYVPTEDVQTTPGKGNDPILRRTTKDIEMDQQAVASIFAESLRRCWTMGLEGDVKIMDAEGKYFVRSNVCVLCDQIIVDRNANDDTFIEGTNIDGWLNTYLQDTTIPSTRGNKPQSYANFLDRDASAAGVFPDVTECEDSINLRNPTVTDGTYATILVRRFSDWADDGAVAKRLGGKSCMTTAVVSATALRNVCNYVTN